jgi:hypothetical protein
LRAIEAVGERSCQFSQNKGRKPYRSRLPKVSRR